MLLVIKFEKTRVSFARKVSYNYSALGYFNKPCRKYLAR